MMNKLDYLDYQTVQNRLYKLGEAEIGRTLGELKSVVYKLNRRDFGTEVYFMGELSDADSKWRIKKSVFDDFVKQHYDKEQA